jgi:hypothetical protein
MSRSSTTPSPKNETLFWLQHAIAKWHDPPMLTFAEIPSSSTNSVEQKDHRDSQRGPPVWICGDCHVSNLGPLANAEAYVEIQIRDLNQTVIGNPTRISRTL